MQRQCRDEVEQIHQFFHDWFVGAVGNDDASFARAAGVLAPEFALVTPRGGLESRDSILDQIRALHGARASTPLRIWIERFTPRFVLGDGCLVMYEEWQQLGAGRTARQATALFRRRDGTPNGVEWLHLHETWLPGRAPLAPTSDRK
jgi:hypothetical protein